MEVNIIITEYNIKEYHENIAVVCKIPNRNSHWVIEDFVIPSNPLLLRIESQGLGDTEIFKKLLKKLSSYCHTASRVKTWPN